MKSRELDLVAPIFNAAYFFVLGCFLSIMGAWVRPLTETVSGFFDDQISGATILAGVGPIALLAMALAAYKVRKPDPYGLVAGILVIYPINFILVAMAVATAINLSVWVTLPYIAPDIVTPGVKYALLSNSFRILVITVCSMTFARALLYRPEIRKNDLSFSSVLFWSVFVASAIFLVASFVGLAQLALKTIT